MFPSKYSIFHSKMGNEVITTNTITRNCQFESSCNEHSSFRLALTEPQKLIAFLAFYSG